MARDVKENKKKTISKYEKISIRLIGIGVAVLLLGVILFLWGEYPFKGTLHNQKVGQFGDFIGGVVGSFWALAGIILLIGNLRKQQKSIKIQEDELKAQRYEFSLNRITDLIMASANKINDLFDNLRITHSVSATAKTGDQAFELLDDRMEYSSEGMHTIYDDDDVPHLDDNFQDEVADAVKLIVLNYDSISRFLSRMNLQINALSQVTNVDDEIKPEVQKLLNMINESIGYKRIFVLKMMKNYLDIYIKHFVDIALNKRVDEIFKAGILTHKLEKVIEFFESIKEEEE